MTSDELIAAIEETGEQFARLVEGLSITYFRYPQSPDQWAPAQVTGHVAEAVTTIATWAKQIADAPGVAIGRAPDDPARLAAAESLRDAAPEQAAAAVREAIAGAVATLRSIPADRWQATGVHPLLGEPSVYDLVERSILIHLRDHHRQVRGEE